MFNVKLFNFSDLILNKKIDKVNFYSYKEGLIGIHNNHEPMQFKISPSKIILKVSNEEIIYYSGYGFANVGNNFLSIIGYPVTASFEKFVEICDKLNVYGKGCQKNFNKFLG